MAQTFTYYEMLKVVRRRNNDYERFVSMLDANRSAIDVMSKAESCVAVGPGYGHLDLAFMERFTPNLTTLIAVEPDAESCTQLTSRLRQELPNLSVQVCQEKIEQWRGVDSPVDVVQFIHSLYFVVAADRVRLMRKLFESVVKPGGFVVATLITESEYHIVFRLLNPNLDLLIDAAQVKQEMVDAGFQLHGEHDYTDATNIEPPLEDEFLAFCKVTARANEISLEEVRQVLETALPGRKDIGFVMKLVIYRKPS